VGVFVGLYYDVLWKVLLWKGFEDSIMMYLWKVLLWKGFEDSIMMYLWKVLLWKDLWEGV